MGKRKSLGISTRLIMMTISILVLGVLGTVVPLAEASRVLSLVALAILSVGALGFILTIPILTISKD